MKRKKRFIFIVLVIAATLALLSGLTACDAGREEPGPDLIVTDWTTYIETAAKVIARQYGAVRFDREVGIDIAGHAIERETQERYDLTVKAAFDFEDAEHRDMGLVRVTSTQPQLEQRVIYESVMADDTIYVDRYNWDTGNRIKTKLTQAPLFEAVKTILFGIGESDVNSSISADMLFRQFANIFFFDCVPNEAGNELTFSFDFRRGIQSAAAQNYFEYLPLAVRKLIFTVAGADDYAGLTEMLPQIRGDLTLKLAADKIDEISVSDLEYEYREERHTFDVDVDLVVFSNHGVEGIEEHLPSDPDAYQSESIFGGQVKGKIALSTGNAQVVSYDYTFQYNVDILQLVAVKGDLTQLSESSWFHLRVEHRCDANCGSYCQGKYQAAKGAVIDLAFAPKDFGTHYVYLSVGLKALLGEENLKPIIGGVTLLVDVFFPEYKLFQIDPSVWRTPTSGDAYKSDVAEEEFWIELWNALQYEGDGLQIDLAKLADLFGLEGNRRVVWESLLATQGKAIDSIRIGIDSIEETPETYDVMTRAIHLYGADVAGVKQYLPRIGVDLSMTAKEFLFRDVNTVHDTEISREVVRIYNEAYENGILYDGTQPISGSELNGLIGSEIAYSITDIYGNESEDNFAKNRMTVVGYAGADLELFDQWQQITLYAVPKATINLDSLQIPDALRKISVRVWIKLTALKSISLRRDVQTGLYEQGQIVDATREELSAATVVLNYENGATRNMRIYADNAAEIFGEYAYKQAICIASANGSLRYDVFGVSYEVKLVVRLARSIELRASVDRVTHYADNYQALTSFQLIYADFVTASGASASWKLPYESATIDGYSLPSVNKIFDKGNSLSENGVRFLRTGTYLLENRFGTRKASVTIDVLPKQEKASSYTIRPIEQTDQDYYVGYEYLFAAQVENTYHGNKGDQAKFQVKVSMAYTDTNGKTAFLALSEPGEYYRIGTTTVNQKEVTLPYAYELSATLYQPVVFRAGVIFLSAGVYKVDLHMKDYTYCSAIVEVKETIDKAKYQITVRQVQYQAAADEVFEISATFLQTNPDTAAVGAQNMTMQWSVKKIVSSVYQPTVPADQYTIRNFLLDGKDAYQKFSFGKTIDPKPLTAKVSFRSEGAYLATLTVRDNSGTLLSSIWEIHIV